LGREVGGGVPQEWGTAFKGGAKNPRGWKFSGRIETGKETRQIATGLQKRAGRKGMLKKSIRWISGGGAFFVGPKAIKPTRGGRRRRLGLVSRVFSRAGEDSARRGRNDSAQYGPSALVDKSNRRLLLGKGKRDGSESEGEI